MATWQSVDIAQNEQVSGKLDPYSADSAKHQYKEITNPLAVVVFHFPSGIDGTELKVQMDDQGGNKKDVIAAGQTITFDKATHEDTIVQLDANVFARLDGFYLKSNASETSDRTIYYKVGRYS